MPETALQVLLQPQGSGVGFEVRRADEAGSVVAKGLLYHFGVVSHRISSWFNSGCYKIVY
jgi:hypothetical protein